MAQTNFPKHPGKISFINGITQEIREEVDATTVPESIRFVESDTGWVPVVKIVDITTETQRTIRQYGPEGQLLRSTVQLAG
jgi:hypothetical protein